MNHLTRHYTPKFCKPLDPRDWPHLPPAGFSLRRRVNDLRANTRLSARATAVHRGSKPATPIVLVKKQGETDRKTTLQCNLLKRAILRTIFGGLTQFRSKIASKWSLCRVGLGAMHDHDAPSTMMRLEHPAADSWSVRAQVQTSSGANEFGRV